MHPASDKRASGPPSTDYHDRPNKIGPAHPPCICAEDLGRPIAAITAHTRQRTTALVTPQALSLPERAPSATDNRYLASRWLAATNDDRFFVTRRDRYGSNLAWVKCLPEILDEFTKSSGQRPLFFVSHQYTFFPIRLRFDDRCVKSLYDPIPKKLSVATLLIEHLHRRV